MNVNNTLLTIAIPTYNRAAFLIRALNSIFIQYDERVEILVSDNASADNTQAIAEEFKIKYPQLKYVRNAKNIGPDANFLQCYNLATGKYVLLLGDDDLLVEKSLLSLLDFLEETKIDCSLVFLNHVFFEGDYVDIHHCSKPFLAEKQSFVTSDKSLLMQVARDRITYMSAFLLRHDAFEQVVDPIKYSNTSFMHTCIVFEATKNENTKFGVFVNPCIAQDSAIENTVFWTRPQEILLVFGQREEYVFCEVAPRFGYDKELMDKIYTDFLCKSWRGSIIRIKANANKFWKEYYKSYAKPVLLRHKRAQRKLRPYVFCPAWIAKLIYKCVRPLYRKIRRKKGEI